MNTNTGVGSQPTTIAVEQAVPVEVHEATERIKVRMRRAAEDIIAIGQDLKLIKEQLPHGAFMPYIERELGMSWDTAQNFMHVAERFGERVGTIPNIGPTALYALSEPSVSEELADAVLAEVAAGKVAPTAKAVKSELARRTGRRTARAAHDSERTAIMLNPATPEAERKRLVEEQNTELLNEQVGEGVPILAGSIHETPIEHATYLRQRYNQEEHPLDAEKLRRAASVLQAWADTIEQPAAAGDEKALKRFRLVQRVADAAPELAEVYERIKPTDPCDALRFPQSQVNDWWAYANGLTGTAADEWRRRTLRAIRNARGPLGALDIQLMDAISALKRADAREMGPEAWLRKYAPAAAPQQEPAPGGEEEEEATAGDAQAGPDTDTVCEVCGEPGSTDKWDCSGELRWVHAECARQADKLAREHGMNLADISPERRAKLFRLVMPKAS